MSLHLIAQVWALKHLDPREKFILLAYADSCSDWPPSMLALELLAYLARKTGYIFDEVRTVMHALARQPALLYEEQ